MPTRSFPARGRRTLLHCALSATLAATFSGLANAASTQSLSQRLAADPRAATAASMTFEQRAAFARDYGFARLMPHAQGATLTVSNCNDAGAGSLRAAVAAAGSGDTIDATQLTCGTITLSTGSIAVAVDDLTINGPGPDALVISNGAKYGRVFNHAGTGALTLTGMHIYHGVVSSAATESGTKGGCVYSNGAVNLGNAFDPANRASGVIVSGCSAIAK